MGRHLLPLPSLAGGLVETWRCELHLHGPAGAEVDVCGVVDVATGYPLDVSGAVDDSWEALAAGRVPYLPAGPWFGASGVIGEALCLHNTLREVDLVLSARR